MIRAISCFLILGGITFLLLVLAKEKPQPPFSMSLQPLFQELGKPIKSLDRALSRIVLLDEMDEKLIGEEIKKQLLTQVKLENPDEGEILRYLNALIAVLSDGAARKFNYEVFLMDGPPNAYALPGGVIVMSKSLFHGLESEAELAAVLGHEMGHIERGHLFDAFRGRMIQQKIKRASVLQFVASVFHNITSITFSKAQEDEADEYSFRLLITKGYDPIALSTFFHHLTHKHGSTRNSTDPIGEFFTTHPHTELRFEKFQAKSKQWKLSNPHLKSYIGKQNLQKRKIREEWVLQEEWSAP